MEKLKSSKYWVDRFGKQEIKTFKFTEKQDKILKKIYKDAAISLTKEINAFISRYSKDNDFTSADLKRMLNTSEIADFRYSIKAYVEKITRLEKTNPAKAAALKKELDILSGRTRIARMEELRSAIKYELAISSLLEEKAIKKHLMNVAGYVIRDTNMALGGGNTFAKLDKNLVKNIVGQNWSGKYYSDRIHKNTTITAKKVMEHVTGGIIKGYDYKRMADDLDKDLKVGYYASRRLIATETAATRELAKSEKFNQMGIKKYKFIAKMDEVTSKICQSLNGRIFDMDKAQIGVNCPPMHPFCRSVRIPVVNNKNMSV